MSKNFNVIVLLIKETPKMLQQIIYILYTKTQLKIFVINDSPCLYYLPNRRIIFLINENELRQINDFKTRITYHNTHTLSVKKWSNALLYKVPLYNQKKIDGKYRHKLTKKITYTLMIIRKEIDHKLSRSVLPELRKVFYFDAQYRELYKICSYDAETSGRFHPHRDTPAPYQHRKYALSLFLNDDYEGGEFVLPEYGLKVKPKANTAFIFPGISTHQVLPVTKGSRMTVITFFVNGTLRPQCKMKAHYYKDKKIVDSDVYPLNFFFVYLHFEYLKL